jgi:hypothetical protein
VGVTANLLINGDMSLLDNVSSAPLFWDKQTAANRLTELASVADPWGRTRSVMHFQATADGTSPQWTSRINSQAHSYNSATARRRNQQATLAGFPAAIEVRCWSKATSVLFNTGGGDFLAASIVAKHYSEANVDESSGQPYYAGLGPDGGVGGQGVSGGVGTWDWRLEIHRFQIFNYTRVAYLDLAFGLHDSDVRGDLWIADPCVRAVL